MGVTPNGNGTAASDKPITELKTDIYYVVIMIDASHPEKAFGYRRYPFSTPFKYHTPVPGVGDPGHTLYYIVKNGVIQAVYSLGPKSALQAARGQATADCTMKTMAYAFKFNISKDKAIKLINETNEKRKLIAEGKIIYNAFVNDTCASTALDILRPYIPSLPQGRGKVGIDGIFINAVTPYWLFEDFKKAGTPYKVYPTDPSRYTKEDPKALKNFYVPVASKKDFIGW